MTLDLDKMKRRRMIMYVVSILAGICAMAWGLTLV